MISPPAYFEAIRQSASRRWDQLEADPELAGPWHQLFRQVQSPRHVLSELLQNADDAGATEAVVQIEDGRFVFSHNGEDFAEAHFASLCRFGYSNKRALHTIGFRGIGFKSTFSLGDVVELSTPTLAVGFHRKRFTEPSWLPYAMARTENRTEIRVAIDDPLKQRELEKNLGEWLRSPVSLLFFKHIRRLQIGNEQVSWDHLGPGPVIGSGWMALQGHDGDPFLVIQSAAEPFPPDALAEIKQERLFSTEQDLEFPPCKVEIVLGSKGRLYVVLPTGVETSLPFACNAPFIQDPARLKIKDPETSPTNRWLLKRVGELAGQAMLDWLEDTSLDLATRSQAYRLLPDVDRDATSLEAMCAAMVEQAVEETIDGTSFILSDSGKLHPDGQPVIIPDQLFDVWPGPQVAEIVVGAKRPPLSRHVSPDDRKKLVNWQFVEQLGKSSILDAFRLKHLPKPRSWRRLLKLWAYIGPEISGFRSFVSGDRLNIVPVQGRDTLHAPSEVVRLGDKRLLQSEADWEFLAEHLLVVNQNWPRFLAEQRRMAKEIDDDGLAEEVETAISVMRAVKLDDASDINRVVEQVSLDFFQGASVSIAKCIQFAQIAAKLNAATGKAFRFVSRDRRLRPIEQVLLFDQDRTLESLFPEAWCAEHLLHEDYTRSYVSCTPDEWRRWIASGRSALHAFTPLAPHRSTIWGYDKIGAEARRRGVTGDLTCPYKWSNFQIEDWDFEDQHWRHWAKLATEDDAIWARVAERILGQPEAFWRRAASARALQVATTGSTKAITTESLLPSWLLKLRELRCLPDTRGFYRKPSELLRRTPETESFLDVEPFVHGRLDVEATRSLLTLLGVRDTAVGPEQILNRLRALAQAEQPPIHEVEKWYRRLDQIIDTCSTGDAATIRAAFREEELILIEGGGWTASPGVFLDSNEEDAPGAATVRRSVGDLSLWRKVGVADRPSADLAILWMKALRSGESLSQSDARRVRALLAKHAMRIWGECGHWLNLRGEWVRVDTLTYALTMQSLVPWSHLHEWVKRQTADFQQLSEEVIGHPPFSGLPHLADCVENRLDTDPLPGRPRERQVWLSQLGAELCRVELEDATECDRIRDLAAQLMDTTWQTTARLETVPYIDGTPAGTPRSAEAVWHETILYVENRPLAKLARAVAQELGRAFRRPEIADAIKLCFDRPTSFVIEYMEENFKLAPGVSIRQAAGTGETAVAEQPTTNGLANGAAAKTHAGDIVLVATSLVANAWHPEDDQAGEDDVAAADEHTASRAAPKRHMGPTIIERFAHSLGFEGDVKDRFIHRDGSMIARTHGSAFPWEHRSAGGQVIRYYWPREHCLERSPLEIDAGVWALAEKLPDLYSLVLASLEGNPIEVSGARLKMMRQEDKLTLYPAAYRLVYGDDRR